MHEVILLTNNQRDALVSLANRNVMQDHCWNFTI